MINKRLIACFDVVGTRLTKAKRFENNIDIGDVYEYAKKIYSIGIDEIIFYDIKASIEKRLANTAVLRKVAKEVFVPFTVGGGIKSVEDMHAILNAGAEKISVDSMAVRNPKIISEGAKVFGSQCIVVSMQAKKTAASSAVPSGYEVTIDGANINTGIDSIKWAKHVEELGAGELVINAVDADGTMRGYDNLITGAIAKTVNIPVIASGGAGKAEHVHEVFTKTRATGAIISSMLYSTRMKENYDVKKLKEYLLQKEVPVRPHVGVGTL